MPSNARNLANLLGTGETTISASKLSADVPPVEISEDSA